MKATFDTGLKTKTVSLLRANYEADAAFHQPSGKLSASQLGKPLLEQVLKIIGVPSKPVEDYTLGLFARGKQVEQWFIDLIKPDVLQKEVSYRGVIGFVDAIKDGQVYEVKSVKNSQVQYLDPENTTERFSLVDGVKTKKRVYNGPKFQDALQGGLYALSEGATSFTIVYISSDDLRVYPHVVRTAEVAGRIDDIITQVAVQLAGHELPPFTPRADFNGEVQAWQLDAKYSNYPEFISLDPDLAMEKLKRQYPLCYDKLVKGVGNGVSKTNQGKRG